MNDQNDKREENEPELKPEYMVVFDDDAMYAMFEEMVALVRDKADAAADAMQDPRDKTILTIAGMMLFYQDTRKFLREYGQVLKLDGQPEYARLINKMLEEADIEIDAEFH